jgi:hypothetical protein
MDQSQEPGKIDSDVSFRKRVMSAVKREIKAIPAALILIIAWFALMSVLATIILEP